MRGKMSTPPHPRYARLVARGEYATPSMRFPEAATHTRSTPIGIPPATLPARIRKASFTTRIALANDGGQWHYDDLLRGALAFRDRLTAAIGDDTRRDLTGDRVAYLVPPGRLNVAVQLGTWLCRGIAVPLAVSHPMRELRHVLHDARPRLVVTDRSLAHAAALAASARALGAAVVELHGVGDLAPPPPPPPPASALPLPADPALIIYTSGTTARPKGVLTTHHNLVAQITALTTAWAWHEDDRILHTLPLHHIHGVVNALACALWSGAACEFGSGAPASTWDRLASGDITLFMAVPTVYARLIRAWEEAPEAVRKRWSRGAAGLRLMVSGSAALPVATHARWHEITGHTLLERYGMTEIGMALSNPLAGERRPGHVGHPLPGVELRIVDDDGVPVPRGGQGEIEVRGPQVFREYWRRPGDTAAAFRDGWFRTGDEACVARDGYHRILGRRNIDIVKTGGYKVSALEVEDLYRTHPAIRDLAAVGVPDPDWGERMCAAWVPRDGHTRPTGPELRSWGKERLAPYKVPHDFVPVDGLPLNAMGKVRKDAVSDMFTDTHSRPGGAVPPRPRPTPEELT